MENESSMERAVRLNARAARWGLRFWTAVLVVPVVVFVLSAAVLAVLW